MDPEATRREFLEQVRLRKLALEAERKKNEQQNPKSTMEPENSSSEESSHKIISGSDTRPEEVSQDISEPAIDSSTDNIVPKDTEETTAMDRSSLTSSTSAQAEVKNSEETNVDMINSTEHAKEGSGTNKSADLEPSYEEALEALLKKPESTLTFSDRLKLKKLRQKVEESKQVQEQSSSDKSTVTTGTDLEEVENVSEEKKQELDTKIEPEATEQESASTDAGDTVLAMNSLSYFLRQISVANNIDDPYTFSYPEDVIKPDEKYRRATTKYTYGPLFLLQFKDKVQYVPDILWNKSIGSKIVIPPGSGPGSRSKSNRSMSSRSSSTRMGDDRMGSRSSSKRKSRRNESERSNRKDRSGRNSGRPYGNDEPSIPKEDVAPLVPSANRWVPKSRAGKSDEQKLAPDGVTELLGSDAVEKKSKSLLNKLTLEKFDRISEEIINVANQSQWEDDGKTLKIVIQQIFFKACDEPHWSSMYAQLCGKFVKDINPEIKDKENEGRVGPKLVLHYLVDRCHKEFEKGWADKLPTNADGSVVEAEMLSEEYYQAAAAKRRGLGLIRLIGHLYCLNLLTVKMIFECFRRLMKDLSNDPSEEILESTVELLETVGAQFEVDKIVNGDMVFPGSALLDSLFDIIDSIIQENKITSRIKFKLIDVKELRDKKRWNDKKKDNGPKTIQQIHAEEEEKARIAQMNSRNGSRSNSRRSNFSRGDRGMGMNMGMGSRQSSRRGKEPLASRDSFISTRTYSPVHSQRTPVQKEDPIPSTPSSTNMFDALMAGEDTDEE